MKKKIRLIILLILLIGISLLLGNKVYASDFYRNGGDVTDFDLSEGGVYNNFCIDDTKTYTVQTHSAKYATISYSQTMGLILN